MSPSSRSALCDIDLIIRPKMKRIAFSLGLLGSALALDDSIAKQFFSTVESGAGAEAVANFIAEGATFSAQSGPLVEVHTLSGYADWMHGICSAFPDCGYDLKSWAVDQANQKVVAFATFKGTQTGPGPVDPPTGKSLNSDYVYVMTVDDEGKVTDMVKIWNDHWATCQAGWTPAEQCPKQALVAPPVPKKKEEVKVEKSTQEKKTKGKKSSKSKGSKKDEL
jgi:predicted ester cyclase